MPKVIDAMVDLIDESVRRKLRQMNVTCDGCCSLQELVLLSLCDSKLKEYMAEILKAVTHNISLKHLDIR